MAADQSDLNSKALAIIQDAFDYLATRESINTTQEEQGQIQSWRTSLNQLAAILTATGPFTNPANNFTRQILSDQLDLAQTHILGLQETFDFADVDLALRNLQNQVSLLVGTHGSGGGRP